MGIYIENMEIPTTCRDCRLSTFTDFDSMPFCNVTMDDICFNDWETKRCDNCPLAPVPKHGRLGDLNELYEKFARLENEAMNALKTTTTGSVNWIKWSAILTERTGYKYDIADAPTIIKEES